MFGLEILFLVLLPRCLHGFRVKSQNAKRQNVSRAAGQVSHLFTFGAPHPSSPMLTTKSGGCFDGYRVISWDTDLLLDDEDLVPTLLVPSNYNHPNIKALVVVDGGGLKTTWSCGSNPIRVTRPSLTLHFWWVYTASMQRLDNSYWRAKEASAVGLINSYESNLDTVRKNVAQEGWNLVGAARAGEDRSYLLQDPASLRCIVTFEGSDTPSDFVTDAAVVRVEFCGLPMMVHTGFRNELRRMVGSSQWQSEIRPKLGKCSSVDAVGHSLGGATASLFAACVDWQTGSEDYQMMSWTTEAPVRMSPA